MTQMMSVEEVEELIIERLPQVLENDPRFATWLEGFLAQRFPRRDEFAQLINEVQQHRAESAQQFTQVDQRLGKVEEEVRQHRVETAQQFTQVDQRLGKVEEEVRQHRVETVQQFAAVNQRFDQVDQRFDQVDQRFEQVDQHFEQLEQKMGEGFRQVQITIDRLGSRWGIRNESIFRQTMQAVLEDSFGTKVQERYIGGEQFDCVIIDDNHILIEISASVGRDIVRKLQRKRQLYTDETGIKPARFMLAVGSIHSQRANALREAGFEVIEPEVEEV